MGERDVMIVTVVDIENLYWRPVKYRLISVVSSK